jgi:hypothetical protein
LPDLFIIDDSWQEQSWFSTGGTRAKKYLAAPNGKHYYFKRSEYKAAKDGKSEKYYKYEFWSEIIAYEIGVFLGFNVLRYDIAIDGKVVGCISEDMVNAKDEYLIEGVRYLQSSDPNFTPVDYKKRSRYTFQLIESAINDFLHFHSEECLNKMMDMFVFDAIIGNTDRHQENWAIIYKYVMEHFPEYTDALRVIDRLEIAPIYDSGSSLGRELNEDKVNEILLSDKKLDQYILNGKSEVHWLENKISHFELLEKLLNNPNYQTAIANSINRVIQLFSLDAITQIIEEVDNKLND